MKLREASGIVSLHTPNRSGTALMGSPWMLRWTLDTCPVPKHPKQAPGQTKSVRMFLEATKQDGCGLIDVTSTRSQCL